MARTDTSSLVRRATASAVADRPTLRGDARSMRSATVLASGPVSPIGPTHIGQPVSQSQLGDQRARLRQQLALHPPQRRAEADAAGIGVVEEDPRRIVRASARRQSPSSPAFTDRPMSRASHISSSCATCFIANARPITPSRRSSVAYGSALMIDSGISSQYDVVCICCSGRSSSPEPTFSLVWNLIFLKPTTRDTTCTSPCSATLRLVGGKAIEDRHLRVGDRGRVVVAIHFPDVRLAADEVELLDLVDAGLRPCRWPSGAASTARW